VDKLPEDGAKSPKTPMATVGLGEAAGQEPSECTAMNVDRVGRCEPLLTEPLLTELFIAATIIAAYTRRYCWRGSALGSSAAAHEVIRYPAIDAAADHDLIVADFRLS